MIEAFFESAMDQCAVACLNGSRYQIVDRIIFHGFVELRAGLD